jgi:hypothetical protein
MNKKKSDENTIGYWFGIARERGIASPVLLMFDPAPQAEAVYARLSGRSYRRPQGIAGEEPEVLTHTVAETAGVLRDYAGLGGRLMANLLEAPPAGVARWLLSLSGDGIGAIAFVGENFGYQAHAFYDELPPVDLCASCTGKKGPVRLVVTVDDADNGDDEIDLFLRVADISQAGDAMTLARVAANRRIPSVGHSPGFMEFPVGNDELVTILSDFYSDSPQLVAEVVRALGRELGRERHPGRQWLLRTLRTAPALKRLGQKVERLIGTGPVG